MECYRMAARGLESTPVLTQLSPWGMCSAVLVTSCCCDCVIERAARRCCCATLLPSARAKYCRRHSCRTWDHHTTAITHHHW